MRRVRRLPLFALLPAAALHADGLELMPGLFACIRASSKRLLGHGPLQSIRQETMDEMHGPPRPDIPVPCHPLYREARAPEHRRALLRCRHPRLRARVLLYAILSLGGPLAASATSDKRNVLVLASRDSHQPAYEIFMSGFRARADALGRERLELFTEFLDSARFPTAEHRARMRRLLEDKYNATRIDVVISVSPFALQFVLEHRAALFPQAPVVFALVSRHELPPQALPDDMIGILDEFDPVKTLAMAQRLQPQARRVVVVTGADAFDRMWENIARLELDTHHRKGIEFSYLSGLPLPRLFAEVERLPRDTIVLYLSVFRDGAGRITTSPEVAQQVAAKSSAPVYALFPTYFGRGLVGGYLNSFEKVGERTAEVVSRLLSGEKPEQLRAVTGPKGAYLADWRQLQRWGLNEAQLPLGSAVHFRATSIWDSYRRHIIAAAGVMVAQTLLIVMLILQRRRRRIAELEVARQQAELAHASRLATLGELSASIMHEVNQPLGAIQSNADAMALLLDAEPAKVEDARRVLLDLKKANRRASDVVHRIRELLRRQEPEFEPYDLNGAAVDVIRLLDTEAVRREVVVITDFELLPIVRGDRIQVQQVLLNLIVNGFDAMVDVPVGQRQLEVSTALDEQGNAAVVVADAGCGISPDDMPRLFDSFYTTKKDGMGLGLTLCRSIVHAHGGDISVRNRPEGGASFRFTLPVYTEAPVHR